MGAGLAISFLLLFVQLCIVPGYDMGDVATWGMGVVAFIGMFFFIMRGKPGHGTILLGLPILYIAAINAQRWVHGFTEYQIVWYVLGWCLIMISTRANIRIIMWTLLAGVLIQAAIHHFDLIPWGQHFADAKDDVWGSFRHRIRYSTWIYAGVIAAWYLWKTEKNAWVRWGALVVGYAGLMEIFYAHSNTIMALAFLTIVAFLLVHTRWQIAVSFFVVVVMFALVINIEGYDFESLRNMNGRIDMWISCVKGDFAPWWKAIIGHGAGSWELDCGVMGLQMLRHPHNELLSIAYQFGILGVWWTIGLVLLSIWCAHTVVLRIGMAFIFASMLTNSASTYAEQFLLCCVFMGLGIGEFVAGCDNIDVYDSAPTHPVLCEA